MLKDALKKANVKENEVCEVIMGNVLGAGHGQNVARQSAICAGIPKKVSSFAVGKVCGSGLSKIIDEIGMADELEKLSQIIDQMETKDRQDRYQKRSWYFTRKTMNYLRSS